MATNEHREKAKSQRARCAVLTISDTRTTNNDDSGQIIQRTLQDAGHVIADYRIVRDEPTQIDEQLRHWLATGDIDLICCTGGTGITHRDTTVEVVRRLLTKELEGFGELFRMLSFQQVGPAAMLSRAVGGLAGQTLLFAMPGSAQAVQLAMTQLITPELPHLIWERKR